MGKLVYTSRAEQDLYDVWFEIAKHNTQAADRALDHIRDRCEVLRNFPRGGEACPRYGHDMRWFPAGNHVIFYRPDEGGIQVVRVLDGRRDLDAAFFGR
jgi:toxin ParE1/3/4